MASVLPSEHGSPAPRRRTRLARAERRAQIVDAAAALFAERDAAEVTFEEIADAAGVSRALVYTYFGDRHGILEALYRRSVSDLDSRVSVALASVRGLPEAMRRAVKAHLDFARDDPAAYRHASGQVPFAGLTHLAARRRANMAVTMGGGPEAELIARGVIDMTHGMVLHWLDHQDELDEERVIDLVNALLGRGMTGVRAAGLPVNPIWSIPSA